ncbi:MAG: tRNA threonylcarbamoyladenosine dehydratase [Lachnospiraceae bacterium]|nr:tRNA threonylcarbamoyladenosine dehydratase [Lachnospiraceae bacterium]MDY4970555.1 tRNA threonylcarbamoyladenosine dehydratase [Lachnospiraceae bacterium]
MEEQYSRTALLIGEEGVAKLKQAHVAVFGIGGVGGYVTEALARAGVGTLTLFDHDRVSVSNLNRQIIAGYDTVGRYKTEVMKERIANIDDSIRVEEMRVFYLPEVREQYPLEAYDYVVDAIDTVTAKIDLIIEAQKHDVPIISSMGTGNKLNPAAFEVSDIYKTSVCPLAKVMRRELKARGVKKLKVVYSKEPPRKSGVVENGKAVPGSISFVPASAGLLIASEVVKDILNI